MSISVLRPSASARLAASDPISPSSRACSRCKPNTVPACARPRSKSELLVRQFLFDQFKLACERCLLRPDTADLRPDLVAALSKLVDLLRHGRAARLEKVALAVDQFVEVRSFGCEVEQVGFKGDLVGLVAFRFEPSASRDEFEKLPLPRWPAGRQAAADRGGSIGRRP